MLELPSKMPSPTCVGSSSTVWDVAEVVIGGHALRHALAELLDLFPDAYEESL
jgi:hypothetical protein